MVPSPFGNDAPSNMGTSIRSGRSKRSGSRYRSQQQQQQQQRGGGGGSIQSARPQSRKSRGRQQQGPTITPTSMEPSSEETEESDEDFFTGNISSRDM